MRIAPLDITNTPGIYYALAYGLSAILYIHQNPVRKNRWPRLIVIWASLCTFMLFTYQIRIELFLPCVFLEFILVWGMIRAGTDIPSGNQVYFAVRAFLLGEFAASLEWQLYYYALTQMHMPMHFWINVLFLIVIYGIVFSIFWVLEWKVSNRNAEILISRREMWSVILTGAVVYALSNLSYVLKNTPFSGTIASEIFTIHTLADLGGVAILFGYHMTRQELQARQTIENLQQMLQLQYDHYQISVETIALINQKYHDLKHQITVLKSDITEDQKRSYLDEMEEEIRVYEAQSNTGNHVVDTILTEKRMQCQRQQITMTAVADGSALDFLSEMEIASLLGNALENAIDAAKMIGNPEERLIRFSIDRYKSFVRIRVENRVEGKVKMKNGLPQTTKEDKRLHGYGVKSMQDIAARHGGSLQIEVKDGWFRLHLLIPVNT